MSHVFEASLHEVYLHWGQWYDEEEAHGCLWHRRMLCKCQGMEI